MREEILNAISKGAKLYGSVSGGKDGQAMSKVIHTSMFSKLKLTGLIHADLGSVEWPESITMCENLALELHVPLTVVTRTDGSGLLAHWKNRMLKLKGTGKPFWSSSKNRYCTSDLKRDPIDKWFRNCRENFIISCEGIRAEESPGRAKKLPLSIRTRITNPFYLNMSVEEAIANYNPKKRLALTWYPIFNYSIKDVWATYNLKELDLIQARESYLYDNKVPVWWKFHPAYVYGNDRVSCIFCIMGSKNDLSVGKEHHPELLDKMIAMEEEGNATFKMGFSLKNI